MTGPASGVCDCMLTNAFGERERGGVGGRGAGGADVLPKAGHDGVAHHILGRHEHVVVRLVHLRSTQFLPDVTPVRLVVHNRPPQHVLSHMTPHTYASRCKYPWLTLHTASPDALRRHVGTNRFRLQSTAPTRVRTIHARGAARGRAHGGGGGDCHDKRGGHRADNTSSGNRCLAPQPPCGTHQQRIRTESPGRNVGGRKASLLSKKTPSQLFMLM